MPADISAARLPFRVTLMAAALGAAIWLPLSPEDDATLARVIVELVGRDWLQGLLFAVVFGAPHGFGFAAVWASGRGGPYGAALVRAWVALLQTELVLLALIVLRQGGEIQGEGEIRAPQAIIGFAVVSLLFFVHRVASPSVPDHRRDTGFFIRWGALLTVAMFGWFELQWLGGGAAPGLWLHGTLAAAFGLAASVPRER